MFKFTNYIPAGRFRLLSFPFCRYSSQNHYDVLGIPKEASNDEIKKAYYDQSKLHHPDVKDGSHDKFRDITNAYEVLGNPKLRKLYDRGLIFEKQSTAEDVIVGDPETPELEFDPKLDKWSKEQCSSTFARDQIRRNNYQKMQHFKDYKTESKGSQSLFWILMGTFIFFGYLFEKRKLTNSNEKNSPRTGAKEK